MINDIFKSVMKKQVEKIDPVRSKFGKIEKEEVSLSDKMALLEDYCLTHSQFSFRSLLEAQSSKMEIIVCVIFSSISRIFHGISKAQLLGAQCPLENP